jgi:hypothetical protein
MFPLQMIIRCESTKAWKIHCSVLVLLELYDHKHIWRQIEMLDMTENSAYMFGNINVHA